MPERAPILSPWQKVTAQVNRHAWKRHILRYMSVPPAPRPGALALDAGCGTGYGAEGLKTKGYRVTAFDKWPGFAVLAHRLGIEFRECDFMEFAGGPFDVVCCFEVIEHLETPPEAAVRKLRSWVRPGGRAYVSVPIRHPDVQWHRHRFGSEEEVAALWETQFRVVSTDPSINLWVLEPKRDEDRAGPDR